METARTVGTQMIVARAAFLCILVAGAAGAACWWPAGAWPVGLLAVGLAGLWLVARRRRPGVGAWHAMPLLLAFILLAAAAAGLPSARFWAPLSLVAALAAWDLERFAGRLAMAEPSAETRDLEQRHLRRLAAVAGSGLLLGWAGQAIHLKLDLALILLLGFLAILGLNRLVRSLVSESD